MNPAKAAMVEPSTKTVILNLGDIVFPPRPFYCNLPTRVAESISHLLTMTHFLKSVAGVRQFVGSITTFKWGL